MLRSSKRSSRQEKITLAARWIQAVSSCVTSIVLIIGYGYFLFAPDAMNICARLYASTTNVMFGTLGLVVVRWPDKIHRQVMAALDILALAAMVGALACVGSAAAVSWLYPVELWVIAILTSCIAVVANITVIVQTSRTRVQLKLAKENRGSLSLQPKSLKDDDVSPHDPRAYDLEEQYVQSLQSPQSPPPEAGHASACQDIADQMPYSVDSSAHEDHLQRRVEPDDKTTTPSRSLSEICHWSITSGTLTGGGSSVRSALPSYGK